jgi:PTH1 family peptidyl-tRNA hydrolase
VKFLVVGLGNIGGEYVNTRHNIGFNILDNLAYKKNADFSLSRHSFLCSVKHKGKQLILIKPTTFMNLSGKAVKYWMDKEKIRLENLIVITDDLALPFGKIRLKSKGSDGGHNGLKDIQSILNTNKYSRLRFGVGNSFAKGKQSDHVLGVWSLDEAKGLQENIDKATDAILSFTSIGVERTMNIFNTST